MNKKQDNIEEDFNIDDLLTEEEDNPVEMTEEPLPKKVVKKSKAKPQEEEEVEEINEDTDVVNKELSDMEWQPFAQPAYEGLQNMKTGEIINDKEILRRILCYAQEAARGSR